jgi:D-glycerate 3-kinase
LVLPKSLVNLVQQQIQQLDLPPAFLHNVEKYFLPLAEHIAEQRKSIDPCMLVSINGSQGSGKSTMTVFLQLILQHQFNLHTAVVSIDDFYHTRAQRELLAQQIHSLLATRGVPGTHDMQLATRTLHALKNCSQQTPCKIPLFDKAIDDRVAESEWKQVDSSVDVILFEGWCNHAPVQTEAELIDPINNLEASEDADGVWRKYVNQQLIEYHQRLFDQADCLIFLQIPSFEKVYEWRGLQEDKLKKNTIASSQGVMDGQQLIRFIQHYERITRSCLQGLPKIADVVLQIDDEHRIKALQIDGVKYGV